MLGAHRLDAASAKECANILALKAEEATDAIEPNGSAFDETIDAGLGNAEQFGDLVRGQQVAGRR